MRRVHAVGNRATNRPARSTTGTRNGATTSTRRSGHARSQQAGAQRHRQTQRFHVQHATQWAREQPTGRHAAPQANTMVQSMRRGGHACSREAGAQHHRRTQWFDCQHATQWARAQPPGRHVAPQPHAMAQQSGRARSRQAGTQHHRRTQQQLAHTYSLFYNTVLLNTPSTVKRTAFC